MTKEVPRPFRPKFSDVVDPYELPQKLAQNGFFRNHSFEEVSIPTFIVGEEQSIFRYPPIGLDGGILIPSSAIEQTGFPLREYLESRFFPVKKRFAVSHDTTDGSLRFHTARTGQWFSSRGHKYYEANKKFSPRSKAERSTLLGANLTEDRTLFASWERVRDELDRFDPETRWRLLTGIYQNTVNDLIGLSYTHTVATVFDRDHELLVTKDAVAAEVFKTTEAYYRRLLGFEYTAKEERSLFSILEYGPELLDQSFETEPQEVDSIRTMRETDATYQTLAGAETFRQEFDRENPTVIIPLLGAYDLGPALKTLGYQGEIAYILPSVKLESTTHQNMDKIGRRNCIFYDAAFFLDKKVNGRIVLFDDTCGTGGTLARIMEDLTRVGITPTAVRTLYINDRWHTKDQNIFLKTYGEIYKPYFQFPVLRKAPTDGSQIIFSRRVSEKLLLRGD